MRDVLKWEKRTAICCPYAQTTRRHVGECKVQISNIQHWIVFFFWLFVSVVFSRVRKNCERRLQASLCFSYRASFKYYDKGYQQMPLSFVIFLYLHVFSLRVSGFDQPIIRGIPSCCLFVTTWFT